MNFKILICLGFGKMNPSYGPICYGFAKEDLIMNELWVFTLWRGELSPRHHKNKNSALTGRFAGDERDMWKHENKDWH